MKKTEEIKRLLDALETSNKLAAEQIERNRHSIELLWQMLKEGEQGAPFDKPLPPIEIRPDSMYKDTHLLSGLPKDDKAPACLDGKAPHSNKIPSLSSQVMVAKPLEIEVKGNYKEIPVGVVGKNGEILPYVQPEEMKAGEWYMDSEGWLFKFYEIDEDNDIISTLSVDTIYGHYENEKGVLCFAYGNTSFRPATQAEILKYFPNEIECPTHGGNDAAYIKEFTDPQI